MPEPQDIYASPRPFTRAAGTIEDTDGIKTSIATAVGANNYTGVALNGSEMVYLASSLGGGNGLGPARTVSVTTAASVGTYRTGASFPIVFTGTFAGAVVSESLLLTAANGNETIRGSQAFDTITNIAVPGQVDAAGFFQFGVQDIVGWKNRPFRAIKAHADSTLTGLVFQDGVADSIVVVAHMIENILVQKVPRTLVAPGITLYF